MWSIFKKSFDATVLRASPCPSAAAETVPGGATVCCGKPMVERLMRARDRLGQLVFVAGWCCPKCGRTRL